MYQISMMGFRNLYLFLSAVFGKTFEDSVVDADQCWSSKKTKVDVMMIGGISYAY